MRQIARLATLLAVIAAALMAGAGPVAGATLTSFDPVYTGTIAAESEGATTLHNASLGTSTSCNTSFEGQVASHGAGAAEVKLSKLAFTGCNHHVTVLEPGQLKIVTAGENDGTVTWSGGDITIQNTALNVSCLYATNNTHIGTLTGGTPATLDIGSALIPRSGHSFFCGSQGQWTGSFKFTTPSTLLVDGEEGNTTLTSFDPVYTGTIAAESEGATTLHNASLGTSTSCNTAFEGQVATHGAGAAEVELSKLTFTGCNAHVTVISPGQLKIATAGENDGTVTWSGGDITVQNTALTVSCRYTTSNTHIGTLTGAPPRHSTSAPHSSPAAATASSADPKASGQAVIR